MRSPDGNGSSTGEGRKGALLLLRGGRRTDDNGPSDRASGVPSSNALRPDSNLNLGWYRPAAPEGVLREPGALDERAVPDETDRAGESQPTGEAAAIRLDLQAEPSPTDLNDCPLGARRRRDAPAGSSQAGSRRAAGLGRVEIATLRRVAAAQLGRGARAFRPALAVGIGAALAVGLAFAAVAALEQPGHQHQEVAQTGSEHSASRLGGGFLSAVASRLDTLSQNEFRAGGSERFGFGSRAHRLSEALRTRRRQINRTIAVRTSTSSHRSTPISHTAVSSQSVAQGTSGAVSHSGTTAAVEPSSEITPVQQAPVQTSTQQRVNYQPPSNPVGPVGRGSHVGGNCNPKCS
jgi:hypothetical protein